MPDQPRRPRTLNDARTEAEAAFKKTTTEVAELPPKKTTLPNVKELVSLRIDQDVLEHFQEGGLGWQGRRNGALRNRARECAHNDPAPAIGGWQAPDIRRREKSGRGLDHQHPENNGNGIFGAGQRLHHGDGNAESDGRGERDQLARIDLAGDGANDNDDADHAEHDRRNLPYRHALAEKARSKNGSPDRHGEFDRPHPTERNPRQS